MEFCHDSIPATEVARRLDCSMSWLLRCKRALGDRLKAHSQVDHHGQWMISPTGVRLLEELANLRRSQGMPLTEALKQIRHFDPVKGLYAQRETSSAEWRKRYEIARGHIEYLREQLEKSNERIDRERDMMAVERRNMAFERYRSDIIVFQLGRALEFAASGWRSERSLPEARQRLLAFFDSQGIDNVTPLPQPRKLSAWDRIFHPEKMRRAA